MIRQASLWSALCALTVSCGGTTSPDLIPTLPGDGTANTSAPGSAKGGAKSDDPWAGRTDLISAPAAKSPSAVNLPKVERFRLKNGLEVRVVPSAELPVVSMQLAVRGGGQDEARDKVGLASFAAQMLSKGTRTRKAPQIAENIDYVGGSLSANAGFEATTVSCAVTSKNIKTCLTLLPDIVANPVFPEKEMGTIRDGMLAQVRQRRDDAGTMADAHVANFLWGSEHVRGWPLSTKTIKALKRSDLQAWHKRHFVPGNSILAVAGDVDTKALKKELNRAFAGWKGVPVKKRPSYRLPKAQGIRVRLVDKPDQTQSHIRIAHLGLSKKSPDYFDSLIWNYALGGGAFSSRLMKVVRSEGGKTYGASSNFDRHASRGDFTIRTFTRNAETAATIKLLLQELEKMAKGGPTDGEVKDAITNIAGSYSTSFQTPAAVAGAILAAELHGFDESYVRNYGLKVGAVKGSGARRSAKARLRPSDLVIVVVGAAKDVKPQLEAAGWPVEVVDYMQPVAGYERKAIAAAAVAPVDASAEKKARAILDKALKVKGGLSRLRGIKSVLLEAAATLSMGGRSIPATMITRLALPDQMRLDMKIGNGLMENSVAVSGTGGWVKQSQNGKSQVIDLPASETRAAGAQLWRHSELILMRHKDKTVRVEAKPEKAIAGKVYHVVELRSAKGYNATLYINKKTNLIERMSYLENGETSTDEFSDYRVVSGIKVAHKRKTQQRTPAGTATIDIKLSSAKINSGVSAATFKRPKK